MFARHPCESAGAQGPPSPNSSAAGRWVLVAAIVGSSLAFIDGSAVNVALPPIQRELRADVSSIQWVVEGYALFLSALILVGGSLGDILGRRKVFVAGIGLFALASAACAGAQTIGQLNAARCLQGIGAALATPGSLALISANFSDAERGRAIGTWSGFAAITAAIGPLLGGWLAQYASWRYVFLINIPLSALAISVAMRFVPESRDETAARTLDVTGATLGTLSLAGFTYGLIRLQSGRTDQLGLAALIAGAALLAAFLFWEARNPNPMVPLSLFSDVTFSGANLYTFLLYAALGGSLFFVPFDLQNVHGYTPSAAGAAMLPFIIIMFVASRWSGGLVRSVGARLPLVAGALIAGAGFAAYARIGLGGTYWATFFPASAILGVGGALFVAPLTTTVMEAGAVHAGVASGVNNAVARVAGLLAIAGLGILLVGSLHANFERHIAVEHLSAGTLSVLSRERDTLGTGKIPAAVVGSDRATVQHALWVAYTAGFKRAMWASALLAWTAALVGALMIPAAARRQDEAAPRLKQKPATPLEVK